MAEVLGLDSESKADKKRIGAMLKTWVANGALIAEEGKDDRRKPVKFVRVGRPADDVAPPQKVERSKVEQIRPETCSTTTPYRGWGVERSSAPGENQGGANRPVWMDEEDPAVAGFEQGRGLGV
ncbi:hypothetical protein HRJ34_25960 [Rhizorhabdus wittichii]|uniref:Uncharacterized protein n=1 Tax=Rhizorhabdus wittichii TaxID=160791 RepID=A0A975HFA3_9SPHN|nr:hypothetical protein [Rhizorhabdus wittichii]QTH21704.1 hypothetical protein HRJ34_25960 [Rhizorhabdus wittichii]